MDSITEKKILVIDDVPDNFDVITTLLDDFDCCFYYASNGKDAIAKLDIFNPDLILLDVMMPDMNGIEFCHQIKALPGQDMIPIIMVTALSSKGDLAACLAAGANDFISKPLNRLELRARVQSMLKIREQYVKLASFNSRLEQEVVARTRELQTLILRDALTDLHSRIGLLKIMQARSQEAQSSMSVIYLDCDDFKLINTSFGYAVGNELLQAIAQRLHPFLRSQEALARLGGDEFCILLSDADPSLVERRTQEILAAFESPFALTDCEIFITACAGIAINDEASSQAPNTLLQNADTAMHQAKLKGRGAYQLFDQSIQHKIAQRLCLETDLQRAIERQEFVNYYQPIFDLETQKVVALEALVRWRHSTRGMVSPGGFIPCLELTGLVVPVGLMVLRQACEDLKGWQAAGQPDLIMSVNLSARQFTSPTLLADIDQILAETETDPAHLKLEITESAIIENAAAAIEIIQALRSRRIQISLDDFGTGYSSLGYLHRFPINTLKIDRSFVSGQSDQQRAISMVETIMDLGRRLQLSIIAEGIETPEQVAWLRNCQCQLGQGYWFSKPIPADEITEKFLKHPAVI